jgi:hypothetical protein
MQVKKNKAKQTFVNVHLAITSRRKTLTPNHWNSALSLSVTNVEGRAIAQAVSRWLPTATAQVRAQVRSCGICGGQSVTGAGFLRVLRFPLPIPIPPTAPQPSFINRSWYNRPIIGRGLK